MNDVRVEDGSEDIYNKIFGIYDPRRLLAQGIESDFNDQSTNNFFLRVDKLQKDACWIPYQKEFDETRKDQKDASEWTFTDKNNIEVDVVKTICSSITEEMIMNLEYNNPLLSYVIDFSNLPKEIKNTFDEQALIAITAPLIKFYRDMDPTSEKYLAYLAVFPY
ncbi:18840_t:CDS:2 [Racocetra persica]|uniref:18840_t:CDS:1 n=1 Tax=Racocetra persica TaxID=160502 RepID=A0ACA9NEB7_9GLOM|nr:18840_t:CDS:2 [Racocetra persica]